MLDKLDVDAAAVSYARAARARPRSRSSSWSACCAPASRARRSATCWSTCASRPSPGALRDALARALRDPTLELAYWVPEYGAYVGVDGEPVELPADGSGRVATFVERGGDAASPR